MNSKLQRNDLIIDDGSMMLFAKKLQKSDIKKHKKNIEMDKLSKYLSKEDIKELKEIYKAI